MLLMGLASSLAACSEDLPDRLDRGRNPAPQRSSVAIATPEGTATRGDEASGATEHTVGGLILREDESVLAIDEAELLRSEERDEIFVRATVKGPADRRDCLLMEGSTWFALRRAIEDGEVSEAPAMPADFWADPSLTEKFSSGDTYAIVFQEDLEPNGKAADPKDIPFFALCYKDYRVAGDGPRITTWYDVAHVEGTSKVP